MMVDIEDDYMSDSILPIEEEKKSKKRKRGVNIENNIKKSIKEQNEENLRKPISSDNIGFKLLASKGYKPGMSLGIRGGVTEPLPFVLKPDRKGLGMREIELEREKIYADLEQRREEDLIRGMNNFNSRMRKKMEERHLLHLIYKSVKTCRSLDEDKRKKNELLERLEYLEQSDTELSPLTTFMNEIQCLQEEERMKFLESILLYMRNEHLFCLFCGHQFESHEMLNSNCPGLHESDHEMY